MNVFRNSKTTAAIHVSIVQEVTIVIVQMDSNCHKTTRPVNVQKVSRSRQTGPVAWVSTNTKTLAVKKRGQQQLMFPRLFSWTDIDVFVVLVMIVRTWYFARLYLLLKTQVDSLKFVALPFTFLIKHKIQSFLVRWTQRKRDRWADI